MKEKRMKFKKLTIPIFINIIETWLCASFATTIFFLIIGCFLLSLYLAL